MKAFTQSIVKQVLVISLIFISTYGLKSFADGTSVSSGGYYIPQPNKPTEIAVDLAIKSSPDLLKRIFTTILSNSYFNVFGNKAIFNWSGEGSDLRKLNNLREKFLTPQMLKKLSGFNKYNKTIFDIIANPPSFQYEEKCIDDKTRNETDAAANVGKNYICINMKKIISVTHIYDYKLFIVALIGHELSHFTDFTDSVKDKNNTTDEVDDKTNEGERIQFLIQHLLAEKKSVDFIENKVKVNRISVNFGLTLGELSGTIDLKVKTAYRKLLENPKLMSTDVCSHFEDDRKYANSFEIIFDKLSKVMSYGLKYYGFINLESVRQLDSLTILIIKVKRILRFCDENNTSLDLSGALIFEDLGEGLLCGLSSLQYWNPKLEQHIDQDNGLRNCLSSRLKHKASLLSPYFNIWINNSSNEREKEFNQKIQQGFIYNLAYNQGMLRSELEDIIYLNEQLSH